MATGDPATNGSIHTQDLIEKAADQMAQLDMVGKTLGSTNANNAGTNGTAPKQTNGPEEKKTTPKPGGKASLPGKTSSVPASGRASRKTSTSSTAAKKSVEPPKQQDEAPKKLPMNKIKVGSAASPNIKEVKSKIGSLSGVSAYKPSGGNVKIESKKLAWKAESKIGSLGNVTHVPGGGAVKIETKKVELKNVQSKIGSLNNVKHKPGGGEKKIFDDKEYLKRCSSTNSQSGRGSKTPSEAGIMSPNRGTMSPTPTSPAPGTVNDVSA